jgi:hypothetical protein
MAWHANAPHVFQHPQLFLGFDAFSYSSKIQAVCEREAPERENPAAGQMNMAPPAV